ncbi:hypothetical protein M5689_021189 [Euphorbia peplus]|nr:hypothetical protein M5689_021189 [Euphorbia peplus]
MNQEHQFPPQNKCFDTINSPYPSSPPPFIPLPPSSAPITPQKNRDRDQCYKCRELGHWAPQCPKSSPSSTPNAPDLPDIRCPCNRGRCVVRTSGKPQSYMRKFFTCPVSPSEVQCGFFLWCDDVKGVPVCSCGVGIACLNRRGAGPDIGKWYLACRIRKNHGACEFFQWVDYAISSKLKWNPKPNYLKHISRQLRNNVANSVPGNEVVDTKHQMEDVLQSEQDEVLNSDLIMQDVDSSNPSGNQLQAVTVTVTESHHMRKTTSNVSDAEITINEGIFPSFNPVMDSEDEDNMSGIESSSPTQTPRQDLQIFNGFLPEPSPKKQKSDALSKSVFKKLAQSLFDIFESMDPLDHYEMLKVAEAIFTSLRTLSIECNPFVEAVKNYIFNVSKLSVIEGYLRNRLSSHELISVCENEKARFNNISSLHTEALAAYEASADRRHSLQEEISRVKGTLVRLEEQLLCCEAETLEHKARSDEASKDMLESEKSVQAIAYDLEEAVALEREKELVSDAARAAFEAAKVWLEE